MRRMQYDRLSQPQLGFLSVECCNFAVDVEESRQCCGSI